MKKKINNTQQELVILPDGRIMAHNLTPAMAAVLRELNPSDKSMRRRAEASQDELPTRT